MKKIVVANLKMFKNANEIAIYSKNLKKLLKKCDKRVIVCPSFVYIKDMASYFKRTKIEVGAQNCSEKIESSLTGEVGANMLQSVGAKYVIVGHSERKINFGENEKQINSKIKTALKSDLTPIVCLSDQGSKSLRKAIQTQLEILFEDVDLQKEIILAFEPLSAIGTGFAMNLKEIAKAVKVIKEVSIELFSKEFKVLYGGSVVSKNAGVILEIECVDGVLVGGACKDASEFAKICQA